MGDDSIAASRVRACAEAAARVADQPLDVFIHEDSPELLAAVAGDSRLTEDLALALLTRRDLPTQALAELSKNAAVMTSRKVIMAVVAHPHTPRHVSLPMARHLYTFELMSLALLPAVAADLKIAVEQAIITRLDTLATGERLTLAKRASTRVATALLSDPDARVIEAALHNPFLTEVWVVKAVMAPAAPQALVEAICRNEKWSVHREVGVALLRNEHTPLARAIIFAQSLPSKLVREVLQNSRLPENVKRYLLEHIAHP